MCSQIWFQEYREITVLCNHQDTIVYLAQHVKLLDKFVIKRIKKDSFAYQQAIMEAKLLQSLQHPFIPTLYSVFDEQDALYLVEQYMEGDSLHSICQSEQLPISTILSYSIQLCDLISYLHLLPNPILHLDINPHNIIVNQSRLALIDFSAAIALNDTNRCISRYGTVGFAAPEQFCNKPLDERTDIYGIGSTIKYMLDQNSSSNSKELNREYASLNQIIRKCRRKRRTQRYSRVQQVGSLLSQILERQVGQKKEKELLIAIAGTQSHIGSTHTSLLICSYLIAQKKKCLYAELNNTRAAKYMIMEEQKLNQEAIYEYEHIPILPSVEKLSCLEQYRTKYSVIVVDYGILTSQNMIDFENSDLRFLVYGEKVYELPVTEQCLKSMTSFRNTYFLTNFQTAKESKKLFGVVPKEQCFSLPFEPELSRKFGKCEAIFSQILHTYL